MKPLRYCPPKSSIWGHKMGRKSVDRFRCDVQAFLAEAVWSYESHKCTIHILSGPDGRSEQDTFLEALFSHVNISREGREIGNINYIAETDFEKCLDWFSANQKMLPDAHLSIPFVFSLQRCHSVIAWNFRDKESLVGLDCELGEVYGSMQYLGTRLAFHSPDEYKWVKEVARRTLGITMNDKHIRPRNILA